MSEIAELYARFLATNRRVSIDSRRVEAGGVFVAVGARDAQGSRRGNAFARKAVEESGAVLAIIDDAALAQELKNDSRYWFCADTEDTLQQLGAWHRQQLPRLPIIAVGGSNGKTTTKELLQAALSQRYNCFATVGNLNNHLGLPLSLLMLREEHELAIIEIGANHLGETALLAALTAPQFGIVTNCGKDHLGEYGSIENIIRANAELYDYLGENGGVAFVSAQDKILQENSVQVKNRIFYGGADSDIFVEKVLQSAPLQARLRAKGQIFELKTQLFGAFWADTLAALVCICGHFGVEPADTLRSIGAYEPKALRSQLIRWQGLPVLLDCYNANPSSVAAFLQTAQEEKTDKIKIIVLGEMFELGTYSAAEHAEIADFLQKMRANDAQIGKIILLGAGFAADAERVGALHFATLESLKIWLRDFAQQNAPDSLKIYVKGSRSNKLETVFGIAPH